MSLYIERDAFADKLIIANSSGLFIHADSISADIIELLSFGTTTCYVDKWNANTLGTYNATYCDWSINDASTTVADTYYIVSKRADGTTDGSIVIMSATGAFDSFSNAIGYASNYSNLFRISVADIDTGIDEVAGANVVKGIYDLQGRKAENPSKGIYVINGKKVLIK